MPILYGTDPSQLAQQQMDYDSLYGQANQANADSYNRAQALSFQAALQQQQQAQAAQQNAVATSGAQAFQANQSALDRASRLADVNAEYAGAAKERASTQVDADFKDAQRDAMNGALPTELDKLSTLYPHLNQSQIATLSQLSGAAKLSQLQSIGDSVTKNGGVIDNSALDQLSISKDSPVYEKAQSLVKALQQPYASEYGRQAEYANAGNLMDRINKDRNTPPLPTGSVGSLLNPLNWPGALADSLSGGSSWVPKSRTVQTNPDAVSRLAAIQTSLAPYVNPAAKNPTVSVSPTGRLIPALPSMPWMSNVNNFQAMAPQPAPLVTGTGNKSFNSEAEARAAGYGSGQPVYINGIGLVRLR